MMRAVTAVSVLALTTVARADTAAHAGLNLRADSGAHPVRAIAGFDTGPVDASLTLDPMVLFDGQFDADIMATARLSDGGWGVMIGWRTTSIGILGGRQLQEKPMLGVSAPLPRLGDLPIRVRWTLEAATVLVKHGGGLPTDWIKFQDSRDFVDLINFGMFLTIEYTSASH